ncbi:MAG: DMT family transporter [Clostridia bacterium]|nr:DMT family transporter [Clostridia bacterium]
MKQTTHRRALTGNLLLLLAAAIWGFAFVAQKSGGDSMGALTFNGTRSLVAAVGLFSALPLLDRIGLSRPPADKQNRKQLWLGGFLCGLALFAATNLQQVGLLFTDVSKSGFITTLYIVLVPLLGLLFGRRIGLLNWLGVALAVAGLYLLCARGESGVNFGDVLLLLCALLFAVQIMLVDRFSPRVDNIRLSAIQFLTVGVLNLPLMFIFEQPSLTAMADQLGALLYAALLSSGVAYTLQIVAQKNTEPTAASLLMSLESVFAMLAGWLLLGDSLLPIELLGCGLLFAAIVLAQLPPIKRKEPKV